MVANMTQGKTRRTLGSISLIVGGVVYALVLVMQFAFLSRVMAGEDFPISPGVNNMINTVVTAVGVILLLAGFVLLATARGRAGLYDVSRLPAIGFALVAVIFTVSQVFYRVASALAVSFGPELIAPLNRWVNLLTVAAIVFAAIAVLIRGALPGFARVVAFLPAIVLGLLQTPLPFGYPGYILPQAGYCLMWTVVGITYLVTRPRADDVIPTSEIPASESVPEASGEVAP